MPAPGRPVGYQVIYVAAAVAVSFGSTMARAQDQLPAPAFEVVSIRPVSDPSMLPLLGVRPGGRVEGRGTLEALIRLAYGLESYERVESPRDLSSALSQRFEVHTRAPEGLSAVDRNDVLPMVRRMLAERFALKVRLDTSMQAVWVLRLIKANVLGPGLRPFTEDCLRVSAAARPLDVNSEKSYLNGCTVVLNNDRFIGTTETLGEFARALSFWARRPIVDGTGLKGRFQIDMTFAPETLLVGRRSTSDKPDFIDALRSALGLKLQSEERAVRLLVVEQVGELVEN